MTDTTLPVLTTDVESEALADAQWVDAKIRESHTWELQFLRFRPVRELTDVLTACSGFDAHDDTIVCLTESIALSRSHTGSPSNAPAGYVPLFYAPTQVETDELLEQAVELTRRVQLPGSAFGWRWHKDTQVDPVLRTVTIVLRADHPRLPGEQS